MDFLKNVLPWITVGICILIVVIRYIRSRTSNRKDTETAGNYMCEGMCIDLCIGTAFGTEWISLGMLLGMAAGISIKKKEENKQD